MIKPQLRFGLFLALTLIFYFVISNFLGLSGTEWIGWLTYVCYLPFIYKVQQTTGYYSGKVRLGFFVSGIGAVISSAFMYAYLEFVDDLMIRTAVQNAIEALDQAEANYIEQVAEIRTTITPKFYLIFGTVSGTLIGTFMALIMPAIITKSGD